MRLADFDDVYNMYMWHRKGEITDEQRQIMVGHNKRLLGFLKELGWRVPSEDHYPPPDLID